MRKCVCALAALMCGLTGMSLAQEGAQAPLRFEVISIHPRGVAGEGPSDRRVLPGGRFVATGTTVRDLIRIAFASEDNRIVGAPGWIEQETFDINAITAGHQQITTPEQYQRFLLSLLEDRFQLRFHREQVDAPVYWLVVDKPGRLGAGLKPSTAESKLDRSSSSDGAKAFLKVGQVSMQDVAAELRRQAGRPVEDHTGLSGKYDFRIQWAVDETADPDDSSLFTVLKEQLGLRLQAAKGSVERVVIDGISHPSEN